MRGKDIWKNIGILLAGGLLGALAVWGRGAGAPRDTAEQAPLESGEDGAQEADEEAGVMELVEVEYPFFSFMDDWRLMLCAESAQEGWRNYRFRLYDGDGRLVQDFPCRIEADGLTYRFDNLCDYYGYSDDLAVFPADAAKSGADGLLFSWDDEEDKFVEEPIVIPWYEEVRSRNVFLVTEKEGGAEHSVIYRVNDETRELIELRTWDLENMHLRIYDCLNEAVLYDGEVEWSATWDIENDKYYQDLFWRDLENPWQYSAEDGREIPTARYTLGADGDRDLEEISYDTREELLADGGFLGEEPFYQYYDRFGNLELELYFDESAGRGCGFSYSTRFNYELEKITRCWGFIFEGTSTERWVPEDTFSTLSYRGKDAKDTPGYSETYTYTDDGRLSSYEATGYVEYEGGNYYETSLLSMSWVYRNDGTLFCKDYSHNGKLFSTFAESQFDQYDELGRLVYKYAYITHGDYLYYYIYEDEGEKPAYCLWFDDGMGYVRPTMIVYR